MALNVTFLYIFAHNLMLYVDEHNGIHQPVQLLWLSVISNGLKA